MRVDRLALFAAMLLLCAAGFCAEKLSGNRLTYLDGNDPFYPGLDFPKLTTPQWVGEPGVEAVVILAVDDMRETAKYETFLRPLLNRLKKIDGRAPVSIMVNALTATNAQLKTWLEEGLSLEVHTLAHPCPLFAKGNFAAAADTYHGCVELLNQVAGSHPVAFRMPCCDSMNSPSPRFYAEIFNDVSPAGQFLTIDSSVMNFPTSNDPSLPRELVVDADGKEKFRKYLAQETNAITRVSMKSFVTTIDDYPYPYVIGKLCWEFPAMIPSDWEANNLHAPTNPITVADWKAALDATVLKRGTFTFIFHPHGWIASGQMVDFVDYAVSKHGSKVKFLNFREAQERLNSFLLSGNPLRETKGKDNGARLLDVNGDGFLDVIIANDQRKVTRIWHPDRNIWAETSFPADVKDCRFGIIDSQTIALVSTSKTQGAWRFDKDHWTEDKSLLKGLAINGAPVQTAIDGRDRGLRFRDADNDGQCELIVGNESQNAVFGWSQSDKAWKLLPYALPKGATIVDKDGRDAGLRFVDVSGDGFDDVLFSDMERFSLHQFVSKANPRLFWKVGWNDQVVAGKRTQSANDIPAIIRAGDHPNNGVWFKSDHMWIQNEDTAHLPDKVDRRSFRQLLTADDPPAKSPQESLAAIKVRDGFEVELVASEPVVTDPIAFDWSPDGKLWVVEMSDYPLGLDGKGEPGGKVRILEDVNGDGHYDKSTVFLDGLAYPSGIITWRKGAIISSAPDIFYAEDTDGDGKADVRRVLFSGFTRGNPQHLVNGFDFGLDGWIYGANGDSGGVVRSEVNPSLKAVKLSGQDFRFRPTEGWFEAIEGQTQYGRHRDDWGNWFGNNNPTWLWHYFLPSRYLARNPLLAVSSSKRYLANYENSTKLFPLTRIRQRFNDPQQAGHVTSGNSPTPYRDGLFGPDFSTSVFICDPVHNVIHREVLEADGVSFRSRRAPDEQKSEFLASADHWFRPTMMRTGPDGALYVADMYRLVLEHPEWITKDIQARLDLRAGSGMGRIYRVFPKGAKLRNNPRLDQLDTAGLVAALDHVNGWQRDTAQKLLIERSDASAVPLLETLLTKSSYPKTRIQALHTLNQIGGLRTEALLRSLEDPHPAVREHAILISESFARKATPETADALFPALAGLVDDSNLRVACQLAFTLGEWADSRAAKALVALASKYSENDDIVTAVLSSSVPHSEKMLEQLSANTECPPGMPHVIEHLVALASAEQTPKSIQVLLSPASKLPIFGKFAAAAGLLNSIDRRSSGRGKLEVLKETPELLTVLRSLVQRARTAAADDGATEAMRLAAIKLLGQLSAEDAATLVELLKPSQPAPIQKAALAAVSKSDQIGGDVLAKQWKMLSPSLRNEVISILLSRAENISAFVAALENGDIPPGEIQVPHQQKLLKTAAKDVRERAERIFSAPRSNRAEVLKKYEKVSEMQGDPQKGAGFFALQCAICHRFKGQGNEIGPDLGTIANKSVDALLVAILDPNRAVESRYVSYTAMTRSGAEFSGMVANENANSITLRGPGGTEQTILRADLKDLSSSGLSVMPEGLEAALPPEAMADLISYLLAN